MKRATSIVAVLALVLATGHAGAQSGGSNQQGDSGGGKASGSKASGPDGNKGNRPSEIPNMLKNGMGNAQGTGIPGESSTDTGRQMTSQ